MGADVRCARKSPHRWWGVYLGPPDWVCICATCAHTQQATVIYSPGCKCVNCRTAWSVMYAIKRIHKSGVQYVLPAGDFPEGQLKEVCGG